MKRKIHIIADSRGKELQKRLKKTRDLRFTVDAHPGYNIEDATINSLSKIAQKKPDIVIIMAGICQLTKKEEDGKISLRNTPTQLAIENYMRSITVAKDTIKYYCEQTETEKPIVAITTQTGVEIKKWNKEDIQHPDQNRLDGLIIQLNRRITEENTTQNCPTVWLSKYSHRYESRKGRYHPAYSKLHDGVHPDHELKKKWITEIRKTCRKILGIEEPIKYLKNLKIEIDNVKDNSSVELKM